MTTQYFKMTIAAAMLLACGAFAQGANKIAVYASGNIGANEKKVLSMKMLSSLSSGGKYKPVENYEAFFNGLQEYEKKQALENSQIVGFGKQFGAKHVCLVNILPIFNSYHVSARIIDTETQEIAAFGETGSALKSLDDLAELASELSSQLLYALSPRSKQAPAAAAIPAPARVQVPVPAAAATARAPVSEAPPVPAQATAVAPAAAATGQCKEKYNINELLTKIQQGFPTQLKDCGSKLVKEIALSKMPFTKTPAPEPVPFMTKCTIEGVKGKLPKGFPGADKAISDMQNFIQKVLGAATAGGLDPKKLMSAIGDMDINGLLKSIKSLSANNPCVVDEPYEPEDDEDDGGYDEEEDYDDGRRGTDVSFSLGLRIGFNFSHLANEYGSYESVTGFNTGLAFDFELGETLHLQPGLMYIQKGAKDSRQYGRMITSHYIEVPFLLSLKFSPLRVSAGPYFGICVTSGNSSSGCSSDSDLGISMGLGFDINNFYIGSFYDYGLTSANSSKYMDHYNRTLGFNLGVNL